MRCVKTPALIESLEETHDRIFTIFIKRLRLSIAEVIRLYYLCEARDPTIFFILYRIDPDINVRL